jgi:uncharacterized protein
VGATQLVLADGHNRIIMEPLTHHLWIGLAGGLLGFAHCLGMCGGFVLHLSQGKTGKSVAANQLLWLTGKLSSYLFLGALAGYAGGFIEILLSRQGLFQNLLSYAAGGIIFLMGLRLLGLLPVRPGAQGGIGETLLATLGRKFLSAPTPGAALTLGLITGFLPCPIVLAFLAFSLQSGSVVNGMATMGALGLGTMAPLLLLGCITRLAGIHLRSWAPRAGGIILLLLGLTTALRGTTIYHQLLGCPSKPVLAQVPTDPNKPCCDGEVHGKRSGN